MCLSVMGAATCAKAQFCPNQSEMLSTGFGTRPNKVVCGDVTGDQHEDFVTANDATDNVSVLRADGLGGFLPAQLWNAGDRPLALVLADVDNDLDLDIVTANQTSNDVTILLNDGSGSFDSSFALPVGQAPNDIIAADLTGDEIVDIAVASGADSSIAVLMNLGGGVFEPAVFFRTGDTPSSLAACHFNTDDDYLDLVTGNFGEMSISIHLNQGDGTFMAHQRYLLDLDPWGMTCADVDGSGAGDVIVIDAIRDSMLVLLNDGTGTFGQTRSFASGNGAYTVTAVDLDCDSQLDLITGNLVDDDITIFLNDNGNFNSGTAVPIGPNPTSIRGCDLFGGSGLELVVAYQSGLKLVENTCSPCEVVAVSRSTGLGSVGLLPPVPNPMISSGLLRFELPRTMHARLEIFDVSGRRVRNLLDAVMPQGQHSIRWNGLDQRKAGVSPGIYIARLTAGRETATTRLTLLSR